MYCTSPGLSGLLCGTEISYPSFLNSAATACTVVANCIVLTSAIFVVIGRVTFKQSTQCEISIFILTNT